MKRLSDFFRPQPPRQEEAVTCAPTVDALIQQLGDRDGVTRERARRALGGVGGPAVEPLLAVLKHKNSAVRYEAAMTLRDIGDRRAVEPLVEALGDRSFEVRWVAAEALIDAGRAAVPAVLHALLHNADSTWFRDGCHHVLSHFAGLDLHSAYHVEHHPAWVDYDLREVLRPVMQALEGSGVASRAPVAAVRAMEHFPASTSRQDRHIIPH
jgi:hypothetical protein